MTLSPPTSEAELLQRATVLAGMTLAQLAQQCHQSVPPNQRHAKGWVGQLLETALGATAGSLSEPDFQLLGIELKTLPITSAGTPRESTYVCTVPLHNIHLYTWETSNVWRKLARVLWIPVETEAAISDRRLGMPLLWSPTPEQRAVLQQDWTDFAERISMGQLETLTARHGKYLQIRPKAAHAGILCDSIGATGELTSTLPRGFYLRTTFTTQLLKNHYVRSL
ncbi:MAG: DNA mismatch repair endonuclease MutH [Gammaproteobacteria bacterium]